MKKVCVSDTPQGAAAIFPLPAPRLPRASGPLLALAAEGVQDPGNLGALVRVAAGAGFDEFIAAGSCADVWSPKVIRGSAGLVFKLETSAVSSEQLESFALETEASVYAATGHGGSDYRAIAPAERSILLIGSEGQGLSERWSRHAQVYIPMKPGCESLNAAVAAGVIAFAFAGALGRI
jgi:TrmH family RNA methyltransferase